MNLREKLEYLMARKELRKSDLARNADIAYTTLDNILKRDKFSNVKFDVLEKLCNYFDVDLRYLVMDEITDPNYGKAAPISTDAYTAEEQRLISNYRRAEPADRTAVDAILSKYDRPNKSSAAM